MVDKGFVICLANKKFKINSIYPYIYEMCKDYIVDGEFDYELTINNEDIDLEREKSKKTDIKNGNEVKRYDAGYLESLAVYRKIAELIIRDNTILFHGSVVAVDGVGYLFTAKSGTGKSTHTRLWLEQLGKRAVIINDDKPLVRIDDNGVWVFGTPWDGKHHLSSNITVPLKAVCILNRGNENEIKRISKREAFAKIYQQTYKNENKDFVEKVLKLIDEMSTKVSFFSLKCNMEKEAFEVSYNAMK